MKKTLAFPQFEPFDLVIEAHPITSADVDWPDYAVVKMTPDLLKKIRSVARLCIEHGLESVTLAMKPDRWNVRHKVESNSLHVWGDSFWYAADVKHGDYAIETYPVCISDLLDVLTGGSVKEMTDMYAVWSDNALFCASEPERLTEIIEAYQTSQEPA